MEVVIVRRFLFLLFFFLFSFSVSHAFPVYDDVRIGDSSFRLLSNSENCLGTGEAWVEWDMTRAINSIHARANQGFSFDFVRRSVKTPGVDDWSVRVWQLFSRRTPTFCVRKILVEDANKGGVVEKIERYACGFRYNSSWEKVSDSWEGFEFRAGEKYRLQVVGQKKPVLGDNDVDWVPTFFGRRVSEWAWWNSSWLAKRPIELPSQDISEGETIQVEFDASALGTLANLDDVRVVDENNNVELQRVCEGTGSSIDANCFFSMPNPMSSTAVEQDTTYYLYYNNLSASAPINQYTVTDQNACTWEIGQTCVYDVNEGVRSNDVALQGDYAYKVTGGAATQRWQLDSGLGVRGVDINYSVLFRTTDASATGRVLGVENSTDVWVVYVDSGNMSVTGDGVIGTVNADRWYYVSVYYPDSAATFKYSVWDVTNGFSVGVGEASVGSVEDVARVSGYTNPGETGTIFYYDMMPYGSPTMATGVGAETTTRNYVDLNVWRVDGYPDSEEYPVFNYRVDGNLTIDFNVSNKDNNRMFLDLNYSDSAVQGTGTPIVQDLNLVKSVCPSQNWDGNASVCSWDWNMVNVPDGNYYLLFDVNTWVENAATDTPETVFETTSRTLQVTAPTLAIEFRDENFFYPVQGLTVRISGLSAVSDVNGEVSIGLGGLDFGRHTLSVGQDGNYGTRFFDFDVNQNTKLDLNLLVLQDINGIDVNFQWYASDAVMLQANMLVRAFHEDGNWVGVRWTDSQGRTSFFLDPDTNYYFMIYDGGTPTRYDVVDVTSQIPKDESTLTQVSPYDLLVSTLANRFFQNYSSSINTPIFPNTSDNYIFDYNGGLSYYSRQYEVSVRGNPSTYSLQPYFAPVVESGDYVFYLKDYISQEPLPNVKIVVERVIPGEGTIEILSGTSDAAGTANLALLIGKDYRMYFEYLGEPIRFYYGSDLVDYANIRPTTASTIYNIFVPTSGVVPEPYPSGSLRVLFHPKISVLNERSWGSVDINLAVTLQDKNVSEMLIRVFDTNNVVLDSNRFNGCWADGNWVYLDVDTNTVQKQFAVYVVVDVNSVDGNSFRVSSQHYTIVSAYQFNFIYLANQFALDNNQEGGKVFTSFLAIFLTVIGVGVVSVSGVSGNHPIVLAVFAIGMLGVFLSFGWIDVAPLVLVSVLTFFVGVLKEVRL